MTLRPPRPALAWALVAVLLVWLTNTAAQMASALPLPNQQGGLMAGIGIGVGAAAAGIGWLLKLIRPGAGVATDSEALYRAREVDKVLREIAADMRESVNLLRLLVEDAKANREYREEGREAMAAIHRLEQKP